MTEAEWRAARHPVPMLEPFLRGRLSDRKLRLFQVACCRLHRETHAPGWADGLLDLAEDCSDGLLDRAILKRRVAEVASLDAHPHDHFALVWPYALLEWDDAFFAALAGTMDARFPATADLLRCVVGNPFPRTAPTRRPLGATVLSALARLMGGSPHQPTPPDVEPLPEVPFDVAWRTETVVALSQGVYDDRAFERLPVLADALEDAGCADPDILEHCRGGGPHARGCWVVDAVLGLG